MELFDKLKTYNSNKFSKLPKSVLQVKRLVYVLLLVIE